MHVDMMMATKQEHQQQSQQQPSSSSSYQHQRQSHHQIYPVTEGIRSSQTVVKYNMNFNLFLDYIKIYDLQVLIDLGAKVIQEMVIKYIIYLRDEKKVSRSTINCHCSAILRFMDMNDIESINKHKIRRHYPPDESSHDDRPYTYQEINKILSVCDLRNKAIVLLLVSSGMRIGALPGLQIGDLTKIATNNPSIYRVQVYARTHDKYYTFTTPEAAQAIDSYLDYRKRCGEELKDKFPLFRKSFNKADPFTINVPKFLAQRSIMDVINNALKRSGVKTSEAMLSNAFRKGFMSTCERSAMRSINVKMLIGHNIGVSGHYYRPTESEVLEDYMKAVDALTIDPTHRLRRELEQKDGKYSEELERLKRELMEIREILDSNLRV